MDFQIDFPAQPRFPILAPAGTAAAPPYSFSADTGLGFRSDQAGSIGLYFGGVLRQRFLSSFSHDLLADTSLLRFGASSDTILGRDGAANTLALRNLTAAQTLRVYNTTDAGLTNYERLEATWVSNVGYLRTAGAGTGSQRALAFDGSSISFFTAATSRYVISSAGFIPQANNSYDFASAALAARNIFYAGYSRSIGVATGSLPAAATAGAGALIYDTTVNKLKMSNGTTWETITSV
jgi:hypothetical protein